MALELYRTGVENEGIRLIALFQFLHNIIFENM